MPTIVVTTQTELDALPASFPEFTIIEIRGGTQFNRIIVKSQRESSHVEAWGSSHVEAWGSSHVVAWESSHVEARESSAVHNHSEYTTLEIGGFVVAWLLAKAKSVKKIGKNCRTVTPKRQPGVAGWLDDEAVSVAAGYVVVFKRVSADFKTQENTTNETLWAVGSTVTHGAWAPKDEECGAGKFHACSRTYFCDEFRSAAGDRYVAIKVAKKDLFAWPSPRYPHKIAFRSGVVLHECDSFGVKVIATEAATEASK